MLKRTTNSVSGALLLALTGSLSAAAAAAQDPIAPSPATGREAITVIACVTREADYARVTPPEAKGSALSQLLLVTPDSGTPTHSVTGVRELELAQHVGERIEITGTVEPARAVGVLTTADGKKGGSITTEATGATGVTPSGGPAHEPGDALSGTVQTGVVPPAGASSRQDPAYEAAALPRLNATAFRRMGGTCATPASEAIASAVRPSPAAEPAQSRPSIPPSSTREPQSVTAVGCLVQQTPAVGERSSRGVDGETLVLIDASLSNARAVAGGSAVPGSSPSGSGSGTLPDTPRATGNAGNTEKLAFVLAARSGEMRELTQHVGTRVEVVGTVDESTAATQSVSAARSSSPEPDRVGTSGRVEPAPSVAHPSAPTQGLTVTSFRVLAGGTCN